MTGNKYTLIFEETYNSVVRYLASSGILYNVEEELVPVLFVISDFALLVSEKDRETIGNEVLDYIYKRYITSEEQDDKFNARTAFYGEIIRGSKKLRAEWLFGNTDGIHQNPVINCVIAFGDVLINPHCAENYNDAPLMISGAFKKMDFAMIMMDKVVTEFVNLYNGVYSI